MIAPGALHDLPQTVHGHRRVFLVTDPGVGDTPWLTTAHDLLTDAGHDVVVSDRVAANPRADDIDFLASEARSLDMDAVVGLGGGSVLDTAKAVAMLLHNPGSCTEYEGRDRFVHPSAPFVAVPTTCGTGSEVTWVSVISIPSSGRKISVKGDGMFPSWALVDPDLLATLPARLVAETGMDALTHAIEAVVGRAANPASDALAEAAVRALLEFLPDAVADIRANAEAREAVMRASTLAGMAFGNSDVGAVHCLSESIGGLLDHPHGRVNAMLLAPVLRDHGSSIAEPLSRLARRAASMESGEALIGRIEVLTRELGVGAFGDLAVPDTMFDTLARLAAENGSNASNPRTMTSDHYRSILDRLTM